MDTIEEEAAKTQSHATTGDPVMETEEPMTVETVLPEPQGHVGGPPVGNNVGNGPFVPESGYIRGQIMRQAAVLSEMSAFCKQNHPFLTGGSLGALENAEREITAAWKSLLVSAARLEE